MYYHKLSTTKYMVSVISCCPIIPHVAGLCSPCTCTHELHGTPEDPESSIVPSENATTLVLGGHGGDVEPNGSAATDGECGLYVVCKLTGYKSTDEDPAGKFGTVPWANVSLL